MGTAAKDFIEHCRLPGWTLSRQDQIALADQTFRDQVCRETYRADSIRDHPLTAALVRWAIDPWDQDRIDLDDLRQFAYLLGSKRILFDVPLLWQAKTADFDTWAGLDIQILVFCGVDATLKFLRGHRELDPTGAAEYIEECRKTGDFDNLGKYLSGLAEYFHLRDT